MPSMEAMQHNFCGNLDVLEKNNFSPLHRNKLDLQRKLLAVDVSGNPLGGIVHEEVRTATGKFLGNVVHIANPYEKDPLDIVTLPTRCSRHEIEQIRSRIIPMHESYELLVAIAKAYEQRCPILIEGDTSIGKTFVVNRFMEILYGKGARPIDFYCSGQTDVSELIGKWAPKRSGLSDQERVNLDQFLQTSYAQGKIEQSQSEASKLENTTDDIKHNTIKHKLSQLMAECGLGASMQWEFSYGAVPKAMKANVENGGKITIPQRGGSGTILKVDEVGLAEPSVVMALLRIRGEGGKLADQIQLWEAGGEVVNAGSDFFVIYTTNPSDKDYLERKEIDPALARSVVWVRFDSLSEKSLTLAAQKYLTFSAGNDPGRLPLRCMVDLRREKEIGIELAEIAAIVHRRYIELMKVGEVGRRQKLPASLDHLARLANYIQCNQVIGLNDNIVDFGETFKRAVKYVYLSGLIDINIKQTIEKEVEMLLADDALGVKDYKGNKIKRSEILKQLSEKASANIMSQAASIARKIATDRQILSGVSNSILAQLCLPKISLVNKVIPQIEQALDMLSDEHKLELVDEILSKDKPYEREESEWLEFVSALTLIKTKSIA